MSVVMVAHISLRASRSGPGSLSSPKTGAGRHPSRRIWHTALATEGMNH